MEFPYLIWYANAKQKNSADHKAAQCLLKSHYFGLSSFLSWNYSPGKLVVCKRVTPCLLYKKYYIYFSNFVQSSGKKFYLREDNPSMNQGNYL